MTPNRGGTLRRAASFVFPLAVAAILLRQVAGRFTRYAVAGQSMVPALLPEDFVIIDRRAYGSRPPAPGHVVLVPDPREPSRQLVKRVIECDPVTGAWLEGDNSAGSTDSRHFGPVSLDAILGRVRWRYWPVARFGKVR